MLALCAGSALAQSGDILINDDTTGGAIQRAPAVAAMPGGGYLVAWLDYRRSDYDPDIYCQWLDLQGTPKDTVWTINHDTLSRRIQDYRKSNPAIAADAQGNALIAWEDYRGGIVNVRYQLAPAGRPRDTIDRRPALTDREQFAPAVAASDSAFFLLWRHHDNEIRGVRIDSLGNPCPEFTVAQISAPGVCLSPSVAAWNARPGVSAGFVAAWQESGVDSSAVRVRWFSSGGQPLSAVMRVGGAAAKRPRVACESLGHGLVVWEEGDRVRGIVFEVLGYFPGNPFAVSDSTGLAAKSPAVSAAPGGGGFITVWQDNRDGPAQAYGQLLGRDGNPEGGNFRLEAEPSAAGESLPAVALSRWTDGGFAAFWTDVREGDANIYGTVTQWPSGPVTKCLSLDHLTTTPLDHSSFRLNSDRASCIQDFPVINLDAEGNARCFWFDYRNGAEHAAVWGQCLDRDGGRRGHNFRVNDDTLNRPADFFWAATNRAGTTVVAWEDKRNGDPDIYAQRYDAECLALGPNFRVSDDNRNTPQTWPFVALNDSGAFVVTWTDVRSRVVSPFAQLYDRAGNPRDTNWRVAYSGREPSAWISNQGDVWLTWISPVGIRLRHFDASGVALDTALHITEGSAGRFGAPKVNGTGLGSVWLVWMDQRRGEWEIYAQKLGSDGRLRGANLRLNDDNVLCEHWLPWLVWDGSDRLYATWTDLRIPGNLDVRCLVMDTAGNARDSSFIVNTDPGPNVNQWAYGSVAARGDNLAFTWIDNRNLWSWDTYARIGLPRVPERRWWAGLRALPSTTRSTCRIRPTLPVRGMAELSIYDALGRKVRQLPAEILSEPGDAVNIDLSDLPNGRYFLRMKVRNLVLGGTVTVLR